MIDIFYDHFLARHWQLYCPHRLEDFANRIYACLENDFPRLPAGLQRIAPHMIRHNWLVSYRQMEMIGEVLARLSARLRRPNPLANGLAELQRHYREMEEDFFEFLPAAASHLHLPPTAEQIKAIRENDRAGG